MDVGLQGPDSVPNDWLISPHLILPSIFLLISLIFVSCLLAYIGERNTNSIFFFNPHHPFYLNSSDFSYYSNSNTELLHSRAYVVVEASGSLLQFQSIPQVGMICNDWSELLLCCTTMTTPNQWFCLCVHFYFIITTPQSKQFFTTASYLPSKSSCEW